MAIALLPAALQAAFNLVTSHGPTVVAGAVGARLASDPRGFAETVYEGVTSIPGAIADAFDVKLPFESTSSASPAVAGAPATSVKALPAAREEIRGATPVVGGIPSVGDAEKCLPCEGATIIAGLYDDLTARVAGATGTPLADRPRLSAASVMALLKNGDGQAVVGYADEVRSWLGSTGTASPWAYAQVGFARGASPHAWAGAQHQPASAWGNVWGQQPAGQLPWQGWGADQWGAAQQWGAPQWDAYAPQFEGSAPAQGTSDVGDVCGPKPATTGWNNAKDASAAMAQWTTCQQNAGRAATKQATQQGQQAVTRQKNTDAAKAKALLATAHAGYEKQLSNMKTQLVKTNDKVKQTKLQDQIEALKQQQALTTQTSAKLDGNPALTAAVIEQGNAGPAAMFGMFANLMRAQQGAPAAPQVVVVPGTPAGPGYTPPWGQQPGAASTPTVVVMPPQDGGGGGDGGGKHKHGGKGGGGDGGAEDRIADKVLTALEQEMGGDDGGDDGGGEGYAGIGVGSSENWNLAGEIAGTSDDDLLNFMQVQAISGSDTNVEPAACDNGCFVPADVP